MIRGLVLELDDVQSRPNRSSRLRLEPENQVKAPSALIGTAPWPLYHHR